MTTLKRIGAVSISIGFLLTATLPNSARAVEYKGASGTSYRQSYGSLSRAQQVDILRLDELEGRRQPTVLTLIKFASEYTRKTELNHEPQFYDRDTSQEAAELKATGEEDRLCRVAQASRGTIRPSVGSCRRTPTAEANSGPDTSRTSWSGQLRTRVHRKKDVSPDRGDEGVALESDRSPRESSRPEAGA